MAVTYGFYDSLSGDRKYNADQLSSIFDGVITDGVFATYLGGLIVTSVGGNMQVRVATGRAWFAHTWTYNSTSLTLTVLASEVGLNRIDTVVLEANKDLATRANSFKIIKGTPASSPVAPTLSMTSTLKQYPLADIYVGAGVTQLSAGNITNRIGTSGCPWVNGPLTVVDSTSLYGQFESDFDAWFANLQDQLSDNQAGNLQAQIDVLKVENSEGWIAATGPWTYSSASVINVPTNATLKYKKGWGVRFKQGGAYKYFYIIGITSTTLTLAGGSDYTVANASITDIYFAPFPNGAFGFPAYFNYVPTISATSGSSTSYTIAYAKFKINSGTIEYLVDFTVAINGTGSGFLTVTGISTTATMASGQLKNLTSPAALILSAGSGSSAYGIQRYDGVYPVSTGQSIRGIFSQDY